MKNLSLKKQRNEILNPNNQKNSKRKQKEGNEWNKVRNTE